MINCIDLNYMAHNEIIFQPSIDTVEEFTLDNSTFSAQYGRNSGAIENIATRPGGNELHGEAFEYTRNDYFDARNYFNPQGVHQSPFVRNNFGADGGGPIRKDKTFFFLSYEGLRQRQGLTINQPVLTNAQRQTVLSSGDPATQKLLGVIPAPNSGTPNLFVGSATAPVDIDQGAANISQNFSTNDHLNFYYNFQRDIRQEPTLQGNNIPGFGDTRQSHRQILTVNETHVFSPELVNEARVGYNRIHIVFSPNALLDPKLVRTERGRVRARRPAANYDPRHQPELRRPQDNFPQGRGDYTAVASDSLTYTRGKHSFIFGGEVRRFDGNSFTATPGTMAFNTTAHFIAGNIASLTANPYANPARVFVTAVGGFVQDSYRVGGGLTLELGFRYEWNGTPVEVDNRFTVFNPVTDALVRVGTQGLNEVYQQRAHNFQPRTGLAWDVFHNGRTIVRTAYAIMGGSAGS